MSTAPRSRRAQVGSPSAAAGPLADREATSRVPAAVADPVAPVDVLIVEPAEIRDPARRPETALQVTHAGLDRALLPRCRRRARGRVETVMPAQVQETRIPDDLL